MRLHRIVGSEVDRFFALLTGTARQTDGSHLEEAVLALRRIQEDALSPKELWICHCWLLSAICSGDWRKPVGDALAKIVAAQWINVSEQQLFVLTSPRLYAPLLKEKCEGTNRGSFSQVASILKIAIGATGIRIDKNVADFLARVESETENTSSSI